MKQKTFVSGKDESVRMFKNDALDAVSRVHWWVPLVMYVPVALFFLYQAIFDYHVAWYEILGLFSLGVVVWTLAEYVLHRFIFHLKPKSKFGERIHFLFHGVHHDYPNDSKRLVMVPSISIPLALVFYGLFYLILGKALVAPFFVGFVIGYLAYDMTHYAVHHANFKSKYFRKLKEHHMRHHFQDPEHGFGVSNRFWDVVFGTKYPK